MKINAAEFDQIAREVFAPVYPVIAEQIIHETGIVDGTCLDVGCGSGYLGLALAKLTDFNIYFFDQSQEMLEIVNRHIADNALAARAQTLLGDVHRIPLDDQAIDLIVSRGSIFFWENRTDVFKEIYRVLAPGGIAYIGGGFGNPELKEQVIEKMKEKNKNLPEKGDFRKKVEKNIGKQNADTFNEELRHAGIPKFKIIRDDSGLWVIISRVI